MKILVYSSNFTLVTQLKTEFQGPGLRVIKIEDIEVVQLPDEPLLVLLDSEYSQEAVLAAIHLRQDQQPEQAPIRTILLAPQNELKTIEKAIDKGFDDFLLSPFSPAELRHRIKLNLRLLEKSSHPGGSAENLIFENAPVSLWQEDFSALKERVEQLRAEGVEDFRQYFQTHPEAVAECAERIKILNVNHQALELHRAKNKAELLAGITRTFTEESFAVFREELVALAEGKTHFESEAVVKTLAGERRNVIIQLFIEPNCQDWSQVYLALTDISEQKKNAAELRENDQRYRDLFNNMSSGVAVYQAVDDGADFVFSDFNRSGEKIENVNRNDIIGKRVTTVFPGVKEFGLLDVFQRVWQTGNPEDHPITSYSDQRLQGWRDNYVYKLPSGEIVAIYDDVTERKQAEEDLLRSRERLSFALHGANSGIWDWDMQADELYFDDNYYKIAGYEPNEFPAAYEEWKKRVHPEDVDAAEKAFEPPLTGQTGGFTTEFRFKTKNGSWMWILGQGKIIEHDQEGNPVRVTGMHTDITNRKKSEEALLASESRLRSILRVAPTGIGIVLDRTLYAPNQKMCEIIGYSPEELIGQSARMLYPTTEEFEYVGQEKYRQISLFGTGTVETRWQRKDGTIIDVLLSSTPINAEKLSEGVTFAALDISARKQAERALRDSEESLRTTLLSIGDAVIATDTQHNIIRMNPVAEQLTGWNSAEAEGKPLQQIFNIFNSKTGKKAENPAIKALKTGKIVGLANHTILSSKDGTEYQIADSAAPIRDTENNITGVVLVFRDVTEEYRTREELQRIHTLERVGILAGGIAHDFNNILMGLFGNIAMAKRKLSSDHPGYENLQKAENSAERAKTLTGKLLTFAKGGEPIRDHVRLADLVKEVAGFDLSGSNVKMVFESPEDLWTADVDKGQIQQVFSNLTTNANQSMPEGGILQINLRNLDNTDNLIQGLAPGKYIQAVIKDNGIGIEAADLARIFDPYFSTRQAGSGLGLATVYSIIHKHDGQISVASDPGYGATFTLLLPATDSEQPQQPTTEIKTTLPLFPTARILIMDDEESIRNLVTEMLKSSGYSVTTACDCQDAIAAYRQAREEGEKFDIVILDLTIPGSEGGKKAIKDILQIDPEAKVIVASGYAEDPVMSRYQEYGFKGVIIKPFSLEELQRVLERIMAS